MNDLRGLIEKPGDRFVLNEVTKEQSYGLLLLGNSTKTFTPVTQTKSGFFLRGDTRCMRHIIINKKSMILAAVNNTILQVYQVKE